MNKENKSSYEADKAAAGIEEDEGLPFIPFIANPSMPTFMPPSPMPGFYAAGFMTGIAGEGVLNTEETSAEADSGSNTPYHETSEYTMIPSDHIETEEPSSTVNSSGS